MRQRSRKWVELSAKQNVEMSLGYVIVAEIEDNWLPVNEEI